jgi:hypothetical protein
VSNFAELFPNADAATARAEMAEFLRANVEGWEPHSGDLDDWIEEAVARLWSILQRQASAIGAAAFAGFGQKIANVPPILAAPATVTSTWTAIDTAGHEIEDGTEVKIPVNGDESRGFVVVGGVVIPPGESATAAGGVLLQAILPGTAGNDLSGTASPISARTAFVESIALVGETANGVDEEGEDEYLNRLATRLQLLSLSLVVARDFEIDAITRGGIARALCIPGYNDATSEADVPLCFTTVPLTSAGAELTGPAREALQEAQAEMVPSGVLNFVGVPTDTSIDVEATATVLPGFDPAIVLPAGQARLASYLDPANSGIPTGSGDPGSSGGWVPASAVYRNELISELDRVPGLDRVVTLKLAKTGLELKVQESVALAGVAPLTKAGTLKVTAA